jgi:hypothetical protein
MLFLSAFIAFLLALAFLCTWVFPRQTNKSKEVRIITGNKRKIDDASLVFGGSFLLAKEETDELQETSSKVSRQKVIDMYLKYGSCVIDDTSFGLPDEQYLSKKKQPVFPVMIKHLIDGCEVGGGKLFNALKEISPKHTVYHYTSTVAFYDGKKCVMLQCIMEGTIRDGSGKGAIDPIFVPISYTLVCIEDDVTTTLEQNINLENPEKKTIGEQPENRSIVHPRIIAMIALKNWLDKNGFVVINDYPPS